MNLYRLRVFPGNQSYLETVTADFTEVINGRLGFSLGVREEGASLVASYPSNVVIIESITNIK